MQFEKIETVGGEVVWVNLDLVTRAWFVPDEEGNGEGYEEGVWNLRIPTEGIESQERKAKKAEIAAEFKRRTREGDWEEYRGDSEVEIDKIEFKGIVQFRGDMGQNVAVVEKIVGPRK